MADDPKPAPKQQGPGFQYDSAWNRLRLRANTTASIATLFIFIMALGVAIGYYYEQSRKPVATNNNSQKVENLTPQELNQLSQIGSNLGGSNQTLNIGANTLFRGNASVTGPINIGGQLNANCPVTLDQLNISGNTAATGLNVGNNLAVAGSTTMDGALTVKSLATLNNGLTVSGQTSVGNLGATSISVKNLSISGPLLVSHLISQGPTPGVVPNNVGAGGTVNISGNDTAGRVNINIGNSTIGTGTALASIQFKSPYSSQVHVMMTPENVSTAQAEIFIAPSTNGFTVFVGSAAGLSAHEDLTFDYVVTQ
jgi:hypothetical protein